ncbi:MAG: STAS/SEC14 domain-containing protein [Pirellulales bacterium]|nr:STAS/SEC14 domain-containing protein [Pirellulales bacterium]
MAVEIHETPESKYVDVAVTGKLTKEDYERFLPALESEIQQHGNVRILFTMHDFHGWTASAMWEDTKFAWHHFSDIERLAIVGETRWEQGMAVFCKPFTAAKIKYFDHAKIEEARKWLAAD